MKKLIIVISILFFCLSANAQQEGMFTQFLYNQQLHNPAYVGQRGIPSLTAMYRQQWAGFDGAPQTYWLGYNSPFLNERVGFGISLSGQNIGIMKNWQASMAYSYKISINEKNAVRVGFQGSIKNYRIDFMDERVYVVNENDGSIVPDSRTNEYNGNFGFGVYAELDKIFLGASIPSFYPNDLGFNNDRKITIAAEAQHWYFLVGGIIPIGNNNVLRPGILGKYVKNAPFDIDFQLSGVFQERITAGLNYRLGGNGHGESIGLNLMYQIKLIALGVAYDIGMSELSKTSAGSFELLARYDFREGNAVDLANPRYQF